MIPSRSTPDDLRQAYRTMRRIQRSQPVGTIWWEKATDALYLIGCDMQQYGHEEYETLLRIDEEIDI